MAAVIASGPDKLRELSVSRAGRWWPTSATSEAAVAQDAELMARARELGRSMAERLGLGAS